MIFYVAKDANEKRNFLNASLNLFDNDEKFSVTSAAKLVEKRLGKQGVCGCELSLLLLDFKFRLKTTNIMGIHMKSIIILTDFWMNVSSDIQQFPPWKNLNEGEKI